MNILNELLTRPMLTKKDLARRWGKSVRTIEIWRRTGYLPKAFFIKGPLWNAKEVYDWERKHRSARTAAAQPGG